MPTKNSISTPFAPMAIRPSGSSGSSLPGIPGNEKKALLFPGALFLYMRFINRSIVITPGGDKLRPYAPIIPYWP